ILKVQVNRLIADLLDKIGTPVPLQARRIQCIEQALKCVPGNLPNKIHQGWCPLANRCENFFSSSRVAGIAPCHDAHLLEMMLLRKHWCRWHMMEAKPAIDVFRRSHDE